MYICDQFLHVSFFQIPGSTMHVPFCTPSVPTLRSAVLLPLHIASGLVDHAGWIIMALIAVGGIAAYIGLRSPLMIRALEVAIDTPSQGSSALWLTVKNRSRTKIEGVQTHLTRVEPEVPA